VFAVDNIETRSILFNKLKGKTIIDARMGGEEFEVYAVLSDADNYEKTLKKTYKSAPCGQQAIIYNVLGISAEVVNIIKRIVKKEVVPFVVRRHFGSFKIISDFKIEEEKEVIQNGKMP